MNHTGSERELLVEFLDWHRAAVHRKLTGLSETDARRRLVGSLSTPAGIVKHLAEVERWWFQMVLAGRRDVPMVSTTEDPDADFRVDDTDTVVGLLAGYEAECAISRELVAALPDLGHVASRKVRGKEYSLRWILLHMIEETARHNGHLDILREQLDGETGE
ncbi:MAG: DinB family protein [Actinomycetes bacterium]